MISSFYYKHVPKVDDDKMCAICGKHLFERKYIEVFLYNTDITAAKIERINLLYCQECNIGYYFYTLI